MRRRSAWPVLVLTGAACLPAISRAQEIEPRAYAASPTGVTFVGLAYGRSTGAVLTDPSLPVDDVEAEINAAGVGVGHTFGFFGRLASATMTLPYVRGDFTGTLDGEPAEASRAGVGDVKLRLAMNFIGTPALTPAEFAKRAPTTTLGASLTVSLPTGEYHGDKLINIGTNRWAIKPEIGVSQPIGRWFLEAYAGAWFFGDNDNFFGGRHREQEPLTSIQAHVAYVFRPAAMARARWNVLRRRSQHGRQRAQGRSPDQLARRHDARGTDQPAAGAEVQLEPGSEHPDRQRFHGLRHRLAVHAHTKVTGRPIARHVRAGPAACSTFVQ